MGSGQWRLGCGFVLVGMLAGCSWHDEVYPPALPARSVKVPWDNSTPFVPITPPPPELAYTAPLPQSLGPSEEEWQRLRAYVPPQRTCTGTGKKRRCTTVQTTAVDRANVTALVKPTAVHTRDGQSVLVIYPISRHGFKVYQVMTSPHEFTNILLPRGERPVAELTLSPQDWQVLYNEPVGEAAVQLIKVRPKAAGQKARDMLLTTSGYPLYLEFVSVERPGMLSVTWELPQLRPATEQPPPLAQRPPKFYREREYRGYTVAVTGKQHVPPPWLPETVVDDGTNTLVRFGGQLEGQRMPTVVGLDQQGKPTIVASRLYVHQDQQEAGYWLYIQGLHPALLLKDAAGLQVKIVRQVPS